MDEGEECDGMQFGSHSCEEYGYTGGTLVCQSDCSIAFARCDGVLATCGDGKVDPGEECDDGNDTVWDGCDGCRISELRVNSSTEYDQKSPSIAMAPDGRFVIVWHSGYMPSTDVYGQLYDADGSRDGTEFQVNSYTDYSQGAARASMAPDGSFVVVWQSSPQDGSGIGVFGQRFDSAGNPVGDEFQVNTTTDGNQYFEDVAVGPDGSFVVVWLSGENVFGQRFDSQGSPVGDEFQISNDATAISGNVRVAARPDGGFVAVWEGWDDSATGIYARIYDSAGNPLGAEFQVNATTDGYESTPDIAVDPDGGFVVVWECNGPDSLGIFGQRFDSGGSPVGGEIQVVVSDTSSSQDRPSVAMSADGGFVVTWKDEDGDSDYGIYARIFDAQGIPVGSEFEVSRYPLGQDTAFSDVAMESNGSFVIVWSASSSEGDTGWDIFLQRFSPEGIPLGSTTLE